MAFRAQKNTVRGGSIRLLMMLAMVSSCLESRAARAVEDVLGPPDILQYPVQAAETAPRAATGPFLRAAIEREADLALCEALMTEAGRTIPSEFQASDCEPEFADKVRNNEGVVHWADNARPLTCGSSCFGRPFMSGTRFVDHPNLRQAMLYGRLKFVLDPPGPINRDVTYSYEARFTCQTTNGARNGDFVVDIKFGDPVIGDPGGVEALLDFLLLPVQLSRRIEAGIRRELASVPGVSNTFSACRSVGVSRADNPFFDAAVYDAPTPGGIRVRPALTATALSDTAKIEFLRITRKPLPPFVPAGHASPGDPAAGYFDVYLNGAHATLPLPLGMALPPEGGSVALNLCKTITLDGADRLQVLFTNGLGGAVWSQFPREDKFGANAPRTMTTGRMVVVPAFPGVPDSVTGRPGTGKPQAVMLREYELLYRITFTPRPDTATTTGPARPGGGLLGDVVGDRPSVAVESTSPASSPCVEI